ncbi:MAG: class I SAM-dependent rRNA methyltransferase [Bdellovibrionales bacterium]|nr:class I SAM-dependent rRNA methyltransferase [Bdellovibrionales bacterium]
MKPIRLGKNLTRDIKRGHPWVYKKALDPKSLPKQSGWYQLADQKGKPLAYGLFDKGSELAFRVFSVGLPKDPVQLMRQRISRAFELRAHLETSQSTSGYRWVHGEGDLLPGLVVDRFAETAVVQFDGQTLHHVWDLDAITDCLLQVDSKLQRVVFKPQSGKGEAKVVHGTGEHLSEFLEHGMKWTADVIHGQKTGFFLDQRENRQIVKSLSHQWRVLNLFCYTGGFSVAAGVGGASQVVSVDISKPAIEAAKQHWQMNDLDLKKHEAHALNVFDYLEQSRGAQFDLVVVDPPAFASSRAAVEKAAVSYEKVFSEAAKKVRPGGLMAFSSCSRPVDFQIFTEIVTASLSKARRVGQVLSISGQPMDHPYPQACQELRYLKFFLLKLD